MNKVRLQPGPIALYYQLQQHLQARIRAGEFGPADPLPTEERLCAEYGVSRLTVRRALGALLADRLISRRRGVGTFVAEAPELLKSITLVGSLDDQLSIARGHRAKVLTKERVLPPPIVRQALQLDAAARVPRVETVYYSSGSPFSYVEFFFPEGVGELVSEADVATHIPILPLLEQKLGQRIVRAEQTIEPAAADRALARHLGIKARAPVLKAVRTYYTESNRPVTVAAVRYHPERYRYTVQLHAQSGHFAP